VTVVPILPVKGVSDELIRILNDRFRQVSQASPASVSGSRVGLWFPHARRPDANLTAVGTYGTETDRGLLYQVQTVNASQVWVYVSGVMRADFASEPTDLGANDEDLLWSVTDYSHLLRWTGTGWEFADGGGKYIADFVGAPDANGWQLCDGSATHYLHITGGAVSEVAFTTPNLTGSPAYKKSGAAYSGTINAAVPPTTSGLLGTVAGSAVSGAASSTHTHTISLPNDPVANLVTLPYFRR
jgi:hypothetical protein